MLHIAVLGDAFVDVLAGTLAPDQLPKWGGDVVCSRPIELQPGGSALNTATHIANLARRNHHSQIQVELHTAIGSDSFGEVVKKHLASRQVTLFSPILDAVPTGVCIVLSGTDDRSFITHYGAARIFGIEHIDEERVLSAHHLHIGGFYSCPKLQGRLKPLIEKARNNGITISLDTNYDGTEQWNGLEDLLPHLDVFMPNEVEAMNVSHSSSVEEAMKYFASRVPGITVIKIGAGGARAFCSKTQTLYSQRSYKTNVVDVTGAGDSFNAGFLSAWKNNGDIQTALQWGCATASRCVSTLGACQVPIDYDDVERLIASNEEEI